jgi:hypothetical protein
MFKEYFMKNVIKAFGIIALVAVIGFSMTACGGDDSGGGKDEEPILTLTFVETYGWNAPGHDDNDRWEVFYQNEGKTFDISDALSKNKVYAFTYSFTSNVDIDRISACFMHKKPDGSDRKDDITDYVELATDIKKNTKSSGKVVITPNSGASGLLKENIYFHILIHNRNVATPATLTFYKFSFELVDNENGTDNDTFNSLDDFKNWLNGKPNNSASSPYNVKLNLPNLSGLLDFLKGLSGKFVKLDFSGSSFTSIGADAFKGLTNLTGITLPSGITSIGANAFDGCTNLNSVTFNGTITSGNFSSTNPFPGDLRDKYLSGGAGTYTRTSGSTTWTKQGGSVGSGNWTAIANSGNFQSIVWGNNKFIAVGNGIAYSSNGLTWETAISNSDLVSMFGNNGFTLSGIAWGNNKFIAGAESGKAVYSSDGITWQEIPGGTISGAFNSTSDKGIAWGNNKFVVVGTNRMAYSEDGLTWIKIESTLQSNFGTTQLYGITYGGGKFIVVGQGGKILYSSDGITWLSVANSTFDTAYIQGIAWGNNKFVAGGMGGKMAYSSDGITWQAVTDSKLSTDITSIAYGNNKFVAVGRSGKMANSSDGITWSEITNTTFNTTNINGITWGNDKFVAVGNGKMAYSSTGD